MRKQTIGNKKKLSISLFQKKFLSGDYSVVKEMLAIWDNGRNSGIEGELELM